jgi:hypothetical protein
MTPVTYSAANQVIVDAYEALPATEKSSLFWGREDVAPVRKQIKDHYIDEQQRRCCYCGALFPSAHNLVWDAEHVISRNSEPRFLFEPRNLAIACKDCNQTKSDQEVRNNPRSKPFPALSADYKIVHPHFDTYDEHIRWLGSVCQPLTEKGRVTIEICGLLRYAIDYVGAGVVPKNPVFDQMLGMLLNPRNTAELHMALAAVKDYVEKIPQK